MPVYAVEGECSTESFEDVGVQRQAVDAFEEGFDVGWALLLLFGSGLFNWPFDKLLDAGATEISEGAV